MWPMGLLFQFIPPFEQFIFLDFYLFTLFTNPLNLTNPKEQLNNSREQIDKSREYITMQENELSNSREQFN